MTRNKVIVLSALLAGVALAYGAWMAIRAQRDLVTLNVRNLDVRQVVSKIEWQTWESISVDQNVQGKVTLNVRQVPLEEVLRIIGEQTSSRWSAVYPLYSKAKSLAALKTALRGEIDPMTHGWTNLQARGFGRGGPLFGGGGPPGANAAGSSQPVSLQILNKDIPFVALALERYAQARVVPEDGTTATVSFVVKRATVSDAVARLAREAHRRWTKLYVLNGMGRGGPGGPGGPGRPSQFALRGGTNGLGPRGPGGSDTLAGPPPFAPRDPGSSTNWAPRVQAGPPGMGRPGMTDAQRDEMRRQRDTLEDELKQALPMAERQRFEQEQQQRQQELQSLTPEQRQQRFAQLSGGGIDLRNRERIKNSTPEQRVEQQRRMAQMRQRLQQMPPQQPPAAR